MSHVNPFILTTKGQRSKSRGTKNCVGLRKERNIDFATGFSRRDVGVADAADRRFFRGSFAVSRRGSSDS